MTSINIGVSFLPPPKKTNMRWVYICLDFSVFELRLQPISQKVSELIGELLARIHERARLRAQSPLLENPSFLSLLFGAQRQPHARPYNLYQWIVWVIWMFFDYLVAILPQKLVFVSLLGIWKHFEKIWFFSIF